MKQLYRKIVGVFLPLNLLLASGAGVWADEQALLEQVKKLEQRVAELEGKGPAAPAAKTNSWEAWLGATKFSGFASASYVYNFNRTKDITGRLFSQRHNEFEINKLKLTLERPVDYSPDKWDAGYRADLIFGEDAQFIHAGNFNLGQYGDLEQAFVTVNVPVGRGLQVSAGKWVTMLGLEVVEEVANPNWSVGNQFIFLENVTGTGVQLGYKWTDKIDTQVRVYNGWDVVNDNNNSLSYMGRIGLAATDRTSLVLVGYGGPERENNNRDWRYGADLVLTHKLTPKLTVYGQGDYGREDNTPVLTGIEDAQWYGGGVWLTYDFTDIVGVALRGDYIVDEQGARTSGVLGFPVNAGQDLSSITLTLNVKPIKNLQVRPEIRWDHSDMSAFDSKHGPRENQFTLGIGVAYLF